MTILTLTWVGLGCWLVCFWWMQRISSHQHAMLKELHEVTKRIEKLSETEHKLIREVHPQVSEIKEQVDHVAEAVSPGAAKTKSITRDGCA